jgi:L-alanine-DL-glutamate epimerase-like enolase superfamily enzyme
MELLSIKCHLVSSPYKGTKIHGQKNNLKTVAIIESKTEADVGYGEAYVGIYVPEITKLITEYLEKEFININVDEAIKKIKCFKIPFTSNAGIFRSVIGAIETSIYDLKSRTDKVPLYKIFSEEANIPNLYASGGSVITNIHELDEDLRYAEDQGFNAFKMRIGKKAWEEDLKRVSYVKNNFTGNDIMVDSIYGTRQMNDTYSGQLEMYKSLEEYELTWLEEPLPVEKISLHSNLRNSLSIPLAAGEAYSSLTEFEALINVSGVDIIQFDVTQSGGYCSCNEIYNMSIDKNKKTAFHVWGSLVALLSNFHLAVAMKELYFFEVPLLELVFNEDVLISEYKNLYDLFSKAPTDPGLGFMISEETFKKYEYVPGTEYKW